MMLQLVDAVKYCHDNLIVIGLLTPDDVLLLDSITPRIKLARYGLYTSGHELVDGLIGSLWYLAPERLAALRRQETTATFKSDVWAVGLLLLSVFVRERLENIWGTRQILTVLHSMIQQGRIHI